MSDEFLILSEAQHALERPSMYIGSVSLEEQTLLSFKDVHQFRIVPGLLKIIEEIFQNSVDEAIRTSFEHANKISVKIDKDDEGTYIEVVDNGRGIPVVHTGEGWRPELSWTRARAGTSFSKERVTIGANGVGSFLTAVFSKTFIGKTCDGSKELVLVASDNLTKKDVQVVDKKTKKTGTSVKFYPDFSRFDGIEDLTEDHVKLIKDRLTHLAICYPKIVFEFNGANLLQVQRKQIPSLYGDAFVSIQDDQKLIIINPLPKNLDGFQSISYVNGIHIKNGGMHVQYIMNKLIEELRPLIKKKWKIEVAPSQISSGLVLVTYLSGFPNLKFDSQSKERVTNTQAEVSSYLNLSTDDFKSLAKQLIANEKIIMPIIEAILWKKEQEDRKALRDLQKKAKKIQVANHIEAQSKNPAEKILYLTEGLSASGPILEVRDAATVGSYALRGKVMNTFGMKPSEILKNKEYFELTAILGLKFNEPVDDLTYHKIAIMTDADPDGSSIFCSLLNFFSYWPELFERGHVYRVKSPLWVCEKKGKRKLFYTNQEYLDAKLDRSWECHYIKGLGSLEIEDYAQIIENPILIKVSPLDLVDEEYLKIAFGDVADLRKKWMIGEDL